MNSEAWLNAGGVEFLKGVAKWERVLLDAKAPVTH
jgi:hypothetical protein